MEVALRSRLAPKIAFATGLHPSFALGDGARHGSLFALLGGSEARREPPSPPGSIVVEWGTMEGTSFDELEFFRAISASRARALLIGRRALIALGLPVLTRDYDFWLHIDDAALLNAAVRPFDLFPNRSPEDARQFGRYMLQNDETVDVLVARSVSTVDGPRVFFDDVWPRRTVLTIADGVQIFLPTIDDLILTKRFGGRPKDAEDIRLLEALQKRDP